MTGSCRCLGCSGQTIASAPSKRRNKLPPPRRTPAPGQDISGLLSQWFALEFDEPPEDDDD